MKNKAKLVYNKLAGIAHSGSQITKRMAYSYRTSLKNINLGGGGFFHSQAPGEVKAISNDVAQKTIKAIDAAKKKSYSYKDAVEAAAKNKAK